MALIEVKDIEETRERRSIIQSVNLFLLAAELIAKIRRKKHVAAIQSTAVVLGGEGGGGRAQK